MISLKRVGFKFFRCILGLSIIIPITLLFYKTPKILTSPPKFTVQSLPVSYLSSTTSPTSTASSPTSAATPPPASNYSKNLSNNTRRFAIFSSSIHSKLRSYIFYTPIAAAAWQRIGYDVIVVFAGDFTKKSNASLSPQLNVSRTFLKRLGAYVINFQCDISYSIKISQLVRIFAGFLPDTIINDTDYILTTDSDIIPILKQDYELKENTDGFIFNAFCCGIYQRRNKTYDMYPMSHICLPKQFWRNIFLESIQRQELVKSNLSLSDSILLSDKAPFSIDTINLYTRHEFRQIYDSNMTKGDTAWYMDQVYSSMLLNDYCEKHSNIKIDKRKHDSKRLDPNLPFHMWEPSRLKTYGDAHVIHDEIFGSYRWLSFKNLLYFLFNSSLANDFNDYYKQFTLLLRDKPNDH
ncbi:unnamed protein product [Adineta steineri]|uniref:Uncharacterized protein n=3 Tax=Adineta steineri TaxID=433720 RepID=A0A814V6V2_9BILA|nr:unnamed protein product [Adineta steineri]